MVWTVEELTDKPFPSVIAICDEDKFHLVWSLRPILIFLRLIGIDIQREEHRSTCCRFLVHLSSALWFVLHIISSVLISMSVYNDLQAWNTKDNNVTVTDKHIINNTIAAIALSVQGFHSVCDVRVFAVKVVTVFVFWAVKR